MRRPLFAVTLLLVAVAWIKLAAGGWDNPPATDFPPEQPESGMTLYAVGQVCNKEEQEIRLQSVTLYLSDITFQNSVNSEQSIPYEQNNSIKQSIQGTSFQESISSEQGTLFQEKLICELSEDADIIPLGSTVVVRGTFTFFSSAGNPGEFDSAVYYRSLGVGGKLRKAELLAKNGKRWYVRETAYKLKQYFCARLNRILPPEYSGVMCALLFGDKSELDGELKDLYKRNGILHILSISSLHITIIGMGVYKLLRKLGIPIIPSAIGGSMILLFYGLMAGFSISACRAIGMYLLRMGAELLGRSYDMLTALGILAAVMVLKNPYYLQNAGFLLSFSSVLGIGAVYPALAGCGKKCVGPRFYGEKWWRIRLRRLGQYLRESYLASLSITLATLPIQLWNYYEVPIYSVLLNLLILPMMKPLLGAGFLSLIPGLGFAGMADSLILHIYDSLCTLFDRFPFHTWNPGRPQGWQVALYYGILTAIVICEERSRERKKQREAEERREKQERGKKQERGEKQSIGKKLIIRQLKRNLKYIALVTAIIILEVCPASRNRIVFLNVGQGDCCLVHTDFGDTYLFDCGSSSRSSVGKYVLLPCLKYYGISELDAVFVSHPDADHMNGIKELLELAEENHIEVKQLVLPAVEFGARHEQFGELIAAAGGTGDESANGRGDESANVRGSEPTNVRRNDRTQGSRNSTADRATNDTGTGMHEKIRVAYLAAGESWKSGNTRFLCLHPERGYPVDDVNAYSMCIYADFGSISLLLTGDVEGKGEKDLTNELAESSITDVTILKVAHHGSRNATSRELLEQIQPRIAVISCGENNVYSHPHKETLERLGTAGTSVYRTDQCGAVIVEISKCNARIRVYEKPASGHYTPGKSLGGV